MSNVETVARRGDAENIDTELDRDAELPRALHEEFDEVRVEALEGPGAAVEDGHPRAGPGSDVGELEGDVAASHESEAGG